MNVEQRLQRLERMNKILIVLLALSLGAATINWVYAKAKPVKLIVDSIETRTLHVGNPHEKAGVDIHAEDDGMVFLSLMNVEGQDSINLLSMPGGEGSLCIPYQDEPCRIFLGNTSRPDKNGMAINEFSIELRDVHGNPIWTPDPLNPFTPRVAHRDPNKWRD